jgi:hypothetical protein
MIDIGNDLFARLADAVRAQGHIAGRHVDHLARMFSAVFKHEPPVNLDADALKVTPLSP